MATPIRKIKPKTEPATAVAVEIPGIKELIDKAAGLARLARAATIVDDEDLAYVSQDLECIVKMRKAISGAVKAYTDPLTAQVKAAKAIVDEPLDTIEAAEEMLRKLIEAYLLGKQQAERAAAAERARLAEIEARRIEDARRTAEAEAEARRIALEEHQRSRDAAAAAAASAARAASVAATEEAERLDSDGDDEAALEAARRAEAALADEQRIAAAAEAERVAMAERLAALHKEAELSAITAQVTPIAPNTTPLAGGMTTRQVWEHEVTDIVALCAFVASNPTMAHLIAPVDGEIKKLVKEFGDKTDLPGVVVRPRVQLTVHTA